MKKIGIVGGVGWLATVEYYSRLCRMNQDRQLATNTFGNSCTPEMCIESLDLARAIALLGEEGEESSWSRFDSYHRDALRRLEVSGAEIAIIASVTPHHRFAQIVRGIGIPVVDLYEAVARKCSSLGAKTLLVLATPNTMESQVFIDTLARHGVVGAAPKSSDSRMALAALISQLQLGNLDDAASVIAEIAKTSFRAHADEQPMVCLACTELPLAFPEYKAFAVFECGGITYINVVAIHVAAVLDSAVSSV